MEAPGERETAMTVGGPQSMNVRQSQKNFFVVCAIQL